MQKKQSVDTPKKILEPRCPYKEARETKYWLRLLKETDFISPTQFESLYQDAEELARILYSIIKTSE
jgi:four helix bundle protein